MKKILPILLIVLGIVGGGVAGVFLKPAPRPAETENTDPKHPARDPDSASIDLSPPPEEKKEVEAHTYVKIGKQTIIPVVEGGETKALMLFELAVDVVPEANDRTLDLEPRLRDAFLRELFQMSYTGAFMTTFTDERVIEELRRNLVRAAKEHVGEGVKDVLILDVMRQEM